MAEPEGRVLQLNENQRSVLQSFQEIANISDEYLCMQILQQNNWDLNRALSQFVGQTAEEEVPLIRPESSNVTRRNRSSDGSGRNSGVNTPASSSVNRRQQERVPTDEGGLFGLIMVPLRWLFQARPLSLNPDLDTQKFIGEYDLKFGSNHPDFHSGSYQSAVASAFSRSKFLLVYLHSPLHEDTPRFCRDVLGASPVVDYANQHLVTWTGRVWDPEAYGLSTQLRATTFPFMALLVCQSNRTVQIADRIQGFVEEGALLERLQTAVNAHMSVLTQAQREQHRRYACSPRIVDWAAMVLRCSWITRSFKLQIPQSLFPALCVLLLCREEAARLREQQDREYREAAEADRLAAIRQREEAAARAAAEEEARQAAELAAAVELSQRLSREDTLRKLRASFESNPEPPAAGNTDVATVRFQLPTGKKLSRRFLKTDTVQVRDVALVADEGLCVFAAR